MLKIIRAVACISLMLSLFALGGCGSSGVRHGALPEWARTPPVDTLSQWYAVGSGYNQEIAAKHALADIASRLKVAVQSEASMHSDKETRNGQATVTERISIIDELSTGEVSFPGYALQKSEEYDGQFHVLVAVDRVRFVQQYMRDIDAADRSIKENLARLSNKQPIEQYIGKDDLEEGIDDVLALTDLLAAADQNFAVQAPRYRDQASEAISFLAEAKSKLRFNVMSEDAIGGSLQGAVEELFTEEQLPVTRSPSKGDTIVKIDSTVLHKGRDAIGGFEISVKADISMAAKQGHTLGKRSMTLYGASTNSYDYAAQALATDFKEKVNKEGGIFRFLGGSGFGGI